MGSHCDDALGFGQAGSQSAAGIHVFNSCSFLHSLAVVLLVVQLLFRDTNRLTKTSPSDNISHVSATGTVVTP